MPITAAKMIVPPMSELARGRSLSTIRAQIGTNSISVWANTDMATAGICREATLNSRVPTTMNTPPCSTAYPMSLAGGTNGRP